MWSVPIGHLFLGIHVCSELQNGQHCLFLVPHEGRRSNCSWSPPLHLILNESVLSWLVNERSPSKPKDIYGHQLANNFSYHCVNLFRRRNNACMLSHAFVLSVWNVTIPFVNSRRFQIRLFIETQIEQSCKNIFLWNFTGKRLLTVLDIFSKNNCMWFSFTFN